MLVIVRRDEELVKHKGHRTGGVYKPLGGYFNRFGTLSCHVHS